MSVEEVQDITGCRRQLWRNIDVKILQQTDQVAAPAGTYRCGPKSVFQHQVPANHPGDKLAQRGIAVRISRTSNRNQSSEFRIAKSSEGTGNAGKNEADGHSRPSVDGRSLACQ